MSGSKTAPQAGECRVYWARPADWAPGLESLLDGVERERLSRLRQRRDRERFVVGAALARTVVADLAGTDPAGVSLDRTCTDCGAPHGKPRVVDCEAPVELSVSHSADRVAVAVALGTPVGVDVEQLHSDSAALLELVGRARSPGGRTPACAAGAGARHCFSDILGP